ncbi:MAG: BMP family ABC transporter substrate-binding protein [Chloroflexi bacterium]|nr:BMP family ABC transporter substrate-binding protein [Chloroflexota bacterium]
MLKRHWLVLLFLLLGAVALASCGGGQETAAPTQPAEEAQFTFGLLLVGPYNDRGWSQAHFEGGKYVEEKLGVKMVYIDKVNPADRPGTTASQLAKDLVAQGAKLIIFNSDDMKDEALAFAQENPDVYVVHISGDHAWKEGKNYVEVPNLSNLMGKMIYGKMIAGCAAALTTKTGKLGYLGPLINDETRRLAASAYLGAKYCWEKYRGQNPDDLKFKVTWIGFWFHIPGMTLDPTQVADEFYQNGYDVVISGIDTTEALVEAKKFAEQGKEVWAIPYDYEGACEEAPDVCLGVPYFNWGPGYKMLIESAMNGTWKSQFLWLGPDWNDINNPDTSSVGFVKGPGLSDEASKQVDEFIGELANGLQLWKGPLYLQDGTLYLKEGEVATDQQIWYLPQLLKGMEGQSSAE